MATNLLNSQFPSTGSMQGDIDAGLITDGVYNPNIDVSKITPTDSIKLPSLPETDNYSAILASLKGSLPPEPDTSAIEKGQKDILSLMSEQGKESAFRAEQEGAAGVNIDKKALADLQAQLNAVNTEAAAATLNVDRPDQPTKLTAGAILDKGVIERDRTIKALRLSSSIQAMQGNLSLALDQADRAVKLKYDPLKNEIDVLNKQLEFNYKNFNAAEKKRADALKQANDIRLEELELARSKEESWVRTKNSALADGVPLNIVNTAQQFFDAKQEDKARSLLGSYVKPKKVSIEPLSVLDVQRYNEIYPNAGVTAGDTEAIANEKVRALSQPKDFTDEEFRISFRDTKDNENKSYEEAVADLEANPLVGNKDRARLIASEIYGVEAKPLSVRQESIENKIKELSRGGTLDDSDIRFSLKQQGFTSEEINASSVGRFGFSLVDSLSNFLFK